MIKDMTTKLREEDYDIYERFRKETGAEPPGEDATEEDRRAYQKKQSEFVR
jgi:hypothetical protein